MDDKMGISIRAPEETKPELETTPWALKTITFIKKDKVKKEALEPARITVSSSTN